MATRTFDATVQLDGRYVGDRFWSGTQIHSLWNVENMNTAERSQWGLDANGWLQYKSMFSSYSIRYNANDLDLEDCYFDVDLQPAGSGNYEVGLAFRFKDRFSFYYLTFNGGYANWGGKNIRLMKVVGSNHMILQEVTHPVFNTSTVYNFRVELNQGNIRIVKDGAEIINYTDPAPILNGAFGPIVKGQEFAKWRGFQAKSTSPFLVQKNLTNNSVNSDYFDATNSMLLSPSTVLELIQPEIDALLVGKDYETIDYSAFRISTLSSSVKLIFDRVAERNVTDNPDALIYAYMLLPQSPPLPATDLRGTALSISELKLTWTHADMSEDGFKIIDEKGVVKGIVGENVTEFYEVGLTEGTTYTRQIVAFNSAGDSAPSNAVLITTPQTIPTAPTNFAGTALNDKEIRWTWLDNSHNEQSFEVIKKDATGKVEVLALLPAGVTEYLENALEPLTSYTRAVRAANSAGKSGESNEATVITLEEKILPPAFQPVNFFGVGVANDSIIWTWEDLNPDKDGFELLDEQGQVIVRLPKETTVFTETGLYSKMTYRRKVRAYNKGGAGPATLEASATTLGYGYDYTGHPVNPYNLSLISLADTEVTFRWDYENHEEMPAIGFRIYNDLDLMVDTVPLDITSRTIQGLLPDTTYTIYVVAFNELGESLPSNALTFTTFKTPSSTEPDPIDERVETLNDPLFGVTYDEETLDTPKIPAFQSGVGDNLDLTVRNLFEEIPSFEEFMYEVYIKGRYQGGVLTYPEVPFTFQVTCTGFNTQTDESFIQKSDWFSGVVKGEKNGIGLTFASSLSVPIPPYVTGRKFSVEVKDADGNLVSIFDPSQPTQKINWMLDPYEAEEMVGVVDNIFMKNAFFEWRKFSHQGTAQPSNANELGAWQYSEETDELVCTQNTGTFVGAVSPDSYDNYEARGLFRANNWDNDTMAFIIAFAVDDNGREHTLSAIRNNSLDHSWSLIYNFRQSNEIVLDYSDELNMSDSWETFYPLGTVVEVSKYGSIVKARTSMPGDMDTGYELSVHLDSLPELAIFKGARAFGVASWSQEGASLKIERFVGERTEIFTKYDLLVWTNYSESDSGYLDWVSAKATGPVMRVDAFEKLQFTGRIQTPAYQIPWQELNKKYTFDPNGYKLVISSTNPNVELKVEQPIMDFFPTDSTFINIPMTAEVINHTQTAWNPHVHHGYYYLNQREHYLFADDKVLPQDDGTFAAYVYTFPYIIRAYGDRNYEGTDIAFVDDTVQHFLVGTIGDGVDVDSGAGALTLHDGANEGIFTSRLFDFGRAVDEWRTFTLTQDIQADLEGSDVLIEIGAADEFGRVSEWVSQTSGELVALGTGVERLRYRLTLKAGQKAEPLLMDFNQNNTTLLEGYQENIKITDRKIEISDPAFYASGTFMTKPLEYGTTVSDMGTVSFDVELPENTRLELYSVTSDSETHDFKNPTTASPWIPLEFVGNTGKRHTYKIRSAKNAWLVIIIKLHRGLMTQAGSTSVLLDYSNPNPALMTNVHVANNGFELQTAYQPGIYISRPFNMGNADSFSPIEVRFYRPNLADKILIHTITGATPEEVEEAALKDYNNFSSTSKWKEVVNNVIQSSPNKYIAFRVMLYSSTGEESPVLYSLKFSSSYQAYVSPTVEAIVVQGRLFNWIRVVPKVSKIEFAGFIERGFGAEDYLIPLTGEVIANGVTQEITTKTAEELALEWLALQGVSNLDQLVLKDFFAEVDPIYPVELSTDRSGKGRVKAKTTASVGDLIWMQEKLFFNEETQELVIQPVPQTGSPIVIKNAQGAILRQVHFRDSVGKPTLTNVEDLETDESRYLFLEHADADPLSVQVFMDLNGKNDWTQIYGFEVIQNRIVLPILYMPRTPVRVLYKLKNSFYVDYNFDPNKDYARIRVHTTFDPTVKETRELTVKYEVKKEHAYYLVDEVDLNPLHNKVNAGFIYLTDELYPPFKLSLYANPNMVYSNKEELVNFNAYVLDEYGNPVVGEIVQITCEHGTLDIQNHVTDINGMVSAIYKSKNDSSITSDAITVTVVSRTKNNHLIKQLRIDYLQEKFMEKLAIVPEKRIVNIGDVVQLKVIAMGSSNERVVNKDIAINVNVGRVVPTSGKTNPDGELFINYYYPDSLEKPFVLLEATTFGTDNTLIREQNILGTSGV